jgi:hypothetical protein
MVGHRSHGPQRDKSVAKLLVERDDVEAVSPLSDGSQLRLAALPLPR